MKYSASLLTLAVGASAAPNGLFSKIFGGLSESNITSEIPSVSSSAAAAAGSYASQAEHNISQTINVTLPTLWDNICSAQLAVCDLACNETLPYMNKCDAKSGQWACACPGKAKPTIPEWSMPAAYQECASSRTHCEEQCGIGGYNGDEMDGQWYACVNQCTDKWTCGTPEQPQSIERDGGETEEDFEKISAKKAADKAKNSKSALDTQSSASAASLATLAMAATVLVALVC